MASPPSTIKQTAASARPHTQRSPPSTCPAARRDARTIDVKAACHSRRPCYGAVTTPSANVVVFCSAIAALRDPGDSLQSNWRPKSRPKHKHTWPAAKLRPYSRLSKWDFDPIDSHRCDRQDARPNRVDAARQCPAALQRSFARGSATGCAGRIQPLVCYSFQVGTLPGVHGAPAASAAFSSATRSVIKARNCSSTGPNCFAAIS